MTSATFTITGDVNVSVTITELEGGALQFDLQVLDDTGSIGDLNALFFDLLDDSLTDGLIVTGDDVTGVAFKADGVTKVDNYTNMNGEVIHDLGRFDGGVQFGTSGIATDDIRSTSFVLSHETESLSLSLFSMQDFGVRLTSVGTEDGAREDSLKLGETAPSFDDAPNDRLTVTEDELFNEGQPEVTDQLDSFNFSLLDNDPGATKVLIESQGMFPDGNAFLDIIPGSNGGYLILYKDGRVDFSTQIEPGAGDFDYLNDNETAETQFDYTTDNGITATLTVTVTGIGSPGDGDAGIF